MRHLKLIFVILTFLIVYLIYIFANPDDVIYLAVGDSFALGENPYGEIAYGYSDYLSRYLEENHHLKLYTKKFATKDARIKDIYQDILLNKKVYLNDRTISLKASLREASVITLSIGANDIISKINMTNPVIYNEKLENKIVQDVVEELEVLLKEMKKYNKNIIVVGYYNLYPNKEKYNTIFKKVNDAYSKLVASENLIYIDIYHDFPYNETLTNPFSIYPNVKGYEFIYKKIINHLNM